MHVCRERETERETERDRERERERQRKSEAGCLGTGRVGSLGCSINFGALPTAEYIER